MQYSCPSDPLRKPVPTTNEESVMRQLVDLVPWRVLAVVAQGRLPSLLSTAYTYA